MIRTIRASAVSVLLLLAIVCGCHERPHEEHEEEGAEATQPIAVTTAAVTTGTIADVLATTGETASTGTVRIGSPIAGRVTYLRMQTGEEVARGQMLARILSLENEAALNGFALLRGAGAARTGDGPSPAVLEREIAGRAIAVTSPIDGVVVERLHNPGEQVAQGDALFELFAPASLVVVAQAPAESVPRIRHGMPAEVVGAGFTASGRVDSILPSLAAGSLTVPVRIAFADEKPTRLLHAAVECRITLAEHPNALLIPNAALLAPTRGNQGEVAVVEGGHARRKTITVGLRTSDTIEVVGGLAAGDSVIVDRGYGLPDGTAVSVGEHPDHAEHAENPEQAEHAEPESTPASP